MKQRVDRIFDSDFFIASLLIVNGLLVLSLIIWGITLGVGSGFNIYAASFLRIIKSIVRFFIFTAIVFDILTLLGVITVTWVERDLFNLIFFLPIMILLIVLTNNIFVPSLLAHAVNKVAGKTVLSERTYDDKGFIGIYKDTGHGRFLSSKGWVYEGEFVGGVIYGEGRMIFEDGTVHEGSFIRAKLNGEGKITLNDGVIVEGAFIKDKLTGQGKLILPESQISRIISEGFDLNGKGYLVSGEDMFDEIHIPGENLNGIYWITEPDGKVINAIFIDEERIR